VFEKVQNAKEPQFPGVENCFSDIANTCHYKNSKPCPEFGSVESVGTVASSTETSNLLIQHPNSDSTLEKTNRWWEKSMSL
jgi:hypothetical protein